VKIGDGVLWVDRTEVTNAQFAAFVEATGYRTLAERQGSSEVFVGSQDARSATEGPATWWQLRDGASWKYPAGPQDTIAKPNHPVVHVARDDAVAYAEWLGNRLPTEEEWQLLVGGADAARTVPSRAPPKDAAGRPLANFWQGVFPLHDTAEDGFSGTAPVGCFPAGGTGLFDGIANVWEWTASEVAEASVAGGATSVPDWPPASARLGVLRGGSHLCSENYCARYRVSARQPVAADTTAGHIGFRTVRDSGG
jgi:formylglycine-generating enzyme required for sulfatase activity